MRIVVIDSSYGSMLNIDYAAAKESGVGGVILHAGYGSDKSQINPDFKEAYDRAITAGLHVGAFWMNYFDSIEDAKVEAETFSQAIADCKLQLGIYADYEEDTIDYMDRCGGSKSDMTSRLIAFMKKLIELGHDKVRFYTNTNCLNGAHGADALDVERLKPYGFWHAHYNGDENTDEIEYNGLTVVGHQFANNDNKPSWIQGCPNIDVSIFHLDDIESNTEENCEVKEQATEEENEPVSNAESQADTYTVQGNECLSVIGEKLGIDWETIAEINGLSDPYTIYPGQVLQIHTTEHEQPNEQPAEQLVEDNPQEGATVTVLPGEGFWQVAARALGDGNRYIELAQYNELDLNTTLYSGMELRLPQ